MEIHLLKRWFFKHINNTANRVTDTTQDKQDQCEWCQHYLNILDKETPFLLVNQQSLKLDTESMAEQIDFI